MQQKNYNPRILVVEDNALNQKLAGFMIRGWGMEHAVCANGQLAIEKLKSDNFDLVLMDLQMPVMDGYEATGYIRNEMGSAIPIVALTAHESLEEREKCREAGFNEYITKPINEAQLLKVVTGLLLNSDVQK